LQLNDNFQEIDLSLIYGYSKSKISL